MTKVHVFTATPVFESDEPGKESCYEVQWTIPCWREVRKSESLVNAQKIVFETGSPSAKFRTKWLVGLKVVSSYDDYVDEDDGMKARVYWKLLEITGYLALSIKMEVKLQTQLIRPSTGLPKYTDEKTVEMFEGQVVEETSECLQFKPDSSVNRDVISNRGIVRFALKLTVKRPTMSPEEYGSYKMDQFSKKSKEQFIQDQVALLNDHSKNADLKIITSDGVEILAHKTILKARCPVFAAMLNCDLSETATGIIRMTEISAKTMKILMQYFYVGELLPSWSDPDTIVEFLYAAGKYQMTEVLELLDDLLGRKEVWDVDHTDVQLIDFAGKLKLENAEARLLEKIVDKIKKIGTSGELFKRFGFGEEEISEMADVKFGESRILGTMDYLYGANDSEVMLEKGNGMVLLAKVQTQKSEKLEENLLKCFGKKAALVKNADELFELFGRGKQMGN